MDLSSSKQHDIKPGTKSGEGEATVGLLFSDWHTFKTILPGQVNGRNAFNLQEFEKRIIRACKSSLSLIDIERSGTTINQLIIWFGGDLMNGMLRESDLETNAGTRQQEVIYLFGWLKSMISFYLKNAKMKNILILCNDGNHSRDTEKKQSSNRVEHSYEWMIYNLLANEFKEEKSIDFIIADGYHIYQNIYDYRFRFHHGDYIGYHGGVGGVTIPMNKKIGEWNKGDNVYCDIIGHFHSKLIWETSFIKNNSLCGYDPYAISIGAAYSPATQGFIVIDKKRGLTTVKPIFVEKESFKPSKFENNSVRGMMHDQQEILP